MENKIGKTIKGVLTLCKPNFDLWCETYSEIEKDPFIEINGILYWVDEEYTRIKGTVNMNTHKVWEEKKEG